MKMNSREVNQIYSLKIHIHVPIQLEIHTYIFGKVYTQCFHGYKAGVNRCFVLNWLKSTKDIITENKIYDGANF